MKVLMQLTFFTGFDVFQTSFKPFLRVHRKWELKYLHSCPEQHWITEKFSSLKGLDEDMIVA